jgi:site-specific DNA-methyltransferase (adenine-specific)/modification methylase
VTAPRKETLADGIELWLGDCREILPTLGKVAAVLTDPPYGIGEAAGANKSRSNAAPARDYGNAAWDDKTSDEAVALAVSAARHAIVFGGNYYDLPPTSCWLVWDKLNTGDFADCELAWTNLPKAVRRLQYRWNGMLRQNNEPRGDHPTQKPLGVMRWCIGHLPEDARTILDPFMGSGTTGVACVQLGRKFIGIELDPGYFDIACRRISDELKRPRLDLGEPAPPPRQEVLL